MTRRRSVLRWGLGGMAGLAALGGGAAWLSRRSDAQAYDRMAEGIWRAPEAMPPLLHELVRCATLAPNSHNTQPWRFVLHGDGLRVLPDTTRRTPVVDPDDHHLFASLGCAVETMVQAAPALGLVAEADALDQGGAVLRVAAGPHAAHALSDAIARRRSTRAPFDPAGLAAAEVAALEADGASDPRVGLVMVTQPARRASLAELILAGNAAQVRDPAFVAELKSWIRFSHASAMATRDGLFAASTGNPALPDLIGRAVFEQVFTLASETDRLARQLAGSAGFAVFVAAEDNPAHWLAAGRAAQRFCLRATALGLRTAWVNQPVEVAGLRPVLAAWLGLGTRRPDLVLRFGRGPTLPRSLRREVASVLSGSVA